MKPKFTRPLGHLGGQFDPHQYVMDAGWDRTCIEATAARGISAEDAKGLTPDEQAALLDWCKEWVAK